jgi:pilus assembly protein CpaF
MNTNSSKFVGIIDLIGDIAPAIESNYQAAYAPITADELLDPTNGLPVKMASHVAAATHYVQDLGTNSAKGENGEQSFSDALVQARVSTVDSDVYQHISRRIDDLVLGWARTSVSVFSPTEIRWLRARVHDNLLGQGPIEPLRKDARVTEILVNRATMSADGQPGCRAELAGKGLVPAPGVIFENDEDVLNLTRILYPKTPASDMRPDVAGTLPDGARIQVQHRAVTNGKDTFFAIRRHPEKIWTLAELTDLGTISEELAADLMWYSQLRFNIIMAGSTGSGKTTSLNAMCGAINPQHHVLIIEDTLEMRLPSYLFTTRFTSRVASGEAKDISIRDNLKSALRSRPDIIIVGEVRGSEALDMLNAMNTGHEGSVSTVHANSAYDTITRLLTMVMMNGEISEDLAAHSIASSVDLIIFQDRMADHSRKIRGVYEVIKPDPNSSELTKKVLLRPIWTFDLETNQHVKVGEITGELFSARKRVLSENPITHVDVRNLAALSGYVSPK